MNAPLLLLKHSNHAKDIAVSVASENKLDYLHLIGNACVPEGLDWIIAGAGVDLFPYGHSWRV